MGKSDKDPMFDQILFSGPVSRFESELMELVVKYESELEAISERSSKKDKGLGPAMAYAKKPSDILSFVLVRNALFLKLSVWKRQFGELEINWVQDEVISLVEYLYSLEDDFDE